MHSPKHTPTCFKYGRRRCRARFPRKLVAQTRMDPETGVIEIERDDRWVNAYNLWLSLMTHGNHDCQFLLTKDHALAIIYYIMKYISKLEAGFHTKLTVAAAVRKAMRSSDYMSDVDIAKLFLIKTYNKLDTLREVGLPEAISHLLDVPDHYTDAVFESLHTSYLLSYAKHLAQRPGTDEDDQPAGADRQPPDDDDGLDSTIIKNSRGYSIVSQCDDYAHRGPHLAQLAFYDYVSLVYKVKQKGGIPFASDHPQHYTHHQYVRERSSVIPSLLGRLLFVTKHSTEMEKKEDYYLLLSCLFVPWSFHQPHKLGAHESWEQLYATNVPKISPRLRYHIENLDLLHKSKEESQFDAMQQRAKSDEQVDTDADDDEEARPLRNDGDMEWDDENEEMEEEELHATQEDAMIESIVWESLERNPDWYVHEAVDANLDAGFLPSPPESLTSGHNPNTTSDSTVFFSPIPSKNLKELLKSIKAAKQNENQLNRRSSRPTQSTVFLTGIAEVEAAIHDVVKRFTLNSKQARAFTIIAKHSAGLDRDRKQLRMGVFGEGGTGKSTLVNAIRHWFDLIGQDERLVVTATTGSAAVKINGSTLHSAVGIAIEDGDDKETPKSRTSKVLDKDVLAWKPVDYLIVDEVSMMDAKVMVQLNEKLNMLRGSKQNFDVNAFGGVNLLFFGDFYQLPTVSKRDLWKKKLPVRWRQGRDLWTSLNAVVVFDEQMRQAQDPRYGQAMSRVRIHEPTDDDIQLLNSRIGAPILDSPSVPIIVRRHTVRHAINLKRLSEVASAKKLPIVHCKAHIKAKSKMSKEEIYSVIQGPQKNLGDGVLSLILAAPLMITKNLNYLPVPVVNGTNVEFCGLSHSAQSLTVNVIDLPDYLLVKLRSSETVVEIPGFPPNVVPIFPESFRYNKDKKHAKWVRLMQFPVTLAYAISDYKCQGQTYDKGVRVDIKAPSKGSATVMSPYVQLSRARSLQAVSILRPFDPEQLRAPIPEELVEELEWEKMMDEATARM